MPVFGITPSVLGVVGGLAGASAATGTAGTVAGLAGAAGGLAGLGTSTAKMAGAFDKQPGPKMAQAQQSGNPFSQDTNNPMDTNTFGDQDQGLPVVGGQMVRF